MRKLSPNRVFVSGSLVAALVLLTACDGRPTQPDVIDSPEFAMGGKGACPTRADFVASDEAGLLAALAAASPGDVIGLDAFFEVTAPAVIATDNVTITCAASGAGLFSQVQMNALLLSQANDVTIDRLTLHGELTVGAFEAFFVERPAFTNNTVVCGITCMFFAGTPGAKVLDNTMESTTGGHFSGIQIQGRPLDGSRIQRNSVTLGEGLFAQTGIRIPGRVDEARALVVTDNVVVGPWRHSIRAIRLSESQIARNRGEGAREIGLQLLGVTAHNMVRQNIFTGADVAGILVDRGGCWNSLVLNDLRGNGVGAIFGPDSGANTYVGRGEAVVDDGDFDCNGDGAPDPNIIRNASASLNGQSLGPRENGVPLVINGIALQ